MTELNSNYNVIFIVYNSGVYLNRFNFFSDAWTYVNDLTTGTNNLYYIQQAYQIAPQSFLKLG